ncbi:MAG: ABC transporter permease [Gemmatimonadales bacterium]
MDKFFVVAKREYLERVRSRWFIVVTLLVPVIMAAVLVFPIYMAAKGGASGAVRHIAIVDATGAGLGDRVSQALMADSSLGPIVDSIRPRVIVASGADVPAQEKALTAEIQQPNHIVGYLVLTDSSLLGRTARYAGRNASTVSDMSALESVVRQVVMIARLEHEGVKGDVVNDLATHRLEISSERITEHGTTGSGEAGLFAGIIVGVLLLMSVVIHGQNVLRGVLEENTTRVAEVVISSVKPETLLAGKIAGVGAVGLTQQVAWFAIGLYLMNFFTPLVMKAAGGAAHAAGGAALGASLPSIPYSMIGIGLLYFIIGFVFYASLYAAAGSMVNSEQEAQQAAAPVMILLMSGWFMVNPVLLKPDSTLAVVLSWLPWTSPIIMPMRIGLTTVSPMAIAGSVAVAILGCVFSVWLAARIYRVGMLMYGKKPSFREVAKWIRYA